MRIGAAFPTTEIGNDPTVIKDFVQAVEEMGYDHLTIIDHVIQAEAPEGDDWRAYYVRSNPFHEPLVMLGYLAALTTRLEFATAILILPQRPAVLVAKQLAELDVLSGGRLRAGVGIGWNALEFEALGQNFKNRARRMEEQIELLRRLWTEEIVSFDGSYHRIGAAGINPLPVQQPIPVWFGAFELPAIRRAGRLGDGWFINPRIKPDEARGQIEVFHEAAREAGRDPGSLGMDATVHYGQRGDNELAAEAEAWRETGVSHLTVRTMYSDLGGIDEHLEALRRCRQALPES